MIVNTYDYVRNNQASNSKDNDKLNDNLGAHRHIHLPQISYRGRIQSEEMITTKWSGISENSTCQKGDTNKCVYIQSGQCRVQQQTEVIYSILYLNLQLIDIN